MPVQRHPIAVPKPDGALTAVPLDHELIGRLRGSYELLRESGLRFAEIFYSKLFAAVPSVQPLFRSDPKLQSEKLLASLDFIVDNLSAPEKNARMLSDLGQRHIGYGARPEHYPPVVSIMIEAMRELLGSRADEKTLEEWRMALDLVSKQMMVSTQSLKPGTPHRSDRGPKQDRPDGEPVEE